MSLINSGEIPEDAVQLSELEATAHMWDVVSNWGNKSDTWALRYGAFVLGAINSVAGVMINRHYRWKFRLGNYGFFSCSVPIVVMPGILTVVFHKHIIATSLLLNNKRNCPICYEVKSTLIQFSLGILYPMVLGPAASLMFANRYFTYRVPHLYEGPKVMFNFLRKHTTKTLTGPLTYLAVLQLAASITVTYYEMKNNLSLKRKLKVLEQKFDEEHYK